MSKQLTIGALLLLASGIASAHKCEDVQSFSADRKHDFSSCKVNAAPEMEIASAGAALALLVGGVIVLRGRKAAKKD